MKYLSLPKLLIESPPMFAAQRFLTASSFIIIRVTVKYLYIFTFTRIYLRERCTNTRRASFLSGKRVSRTRFSRVTDRPAAVNSLPLAHGGGGGGRRRRRIAI